MKSRHLPFLDSIRGIASLAVLLHHCALGFAAGFLVEHIHHANVHSGRQLALYVIVRLLSLGRSSVLMFFVLSGFVLSYSLSQKKLSFGSFAVRRWFRIYPVFLVVVLASFGLHWYLDGPQSFGLLAGHLAMVGTKRQIELDSAIWSLVHELRISLLFPALFWFVRRFRARAVAATLLGSVACTLVVHRLTGLAAEGFNETSFGRTWLETGYFIFFFALGSYVAVEENPVSRRVGALGPAAKGLLTVFCCGALLLGDGGHDSYKFSLMEYLRGVSAAGLIVLAVEFPSFSRILSHRTLTGLGRLSYSLYLIHIPIIYFVALRCSGAAFPLAASVGVIAASLAGAFLLYRGVELPGIALGKWLGRPKQAHPPVAS